MSQETKLIVKIILINFIFGLILLAFLSSKAVTTYPPLPTAWKVKQKVHVKFTNFSDEDKLTMITYIKKQIEPLHLDISLVFDDNLKRPDGLTEGIEFRNVIGTTTVCDKTSTVGGWDEVHNEWAVWKVIKHDITCKPEDGATREGNPIAWLNKLFHEFNHSLHMEHIENKDGIIPPVLMFSDNYLKTIPELFSFADKWQLKRKYSGRTNVVNYKRMNFKRADVGKYCLLVRGNKSVGFRIENQSELLPYLDKLEKYRKVIR